MQEINTECNYATTGGIGGNLLEHSLFALSIDNSSTKTFITIRGICKENESDKKRAGRSPQIYHGLVSASDTGDINLDTIRHDLDRARSERTNPTAKNVRYNQQLRRYLQMRNERESKPTKLELSKGLSVLVKRDGEEEAEVVDTPQPPAQGQRRITQTQQTSRPQPSNRQQSRKRKATNLRADDSSHIKKNLTTADREAIQRFQWQIGRKRALRRPTRNVPERDLVAEAAAAPIIDEDDDDDYLFENGSTLPAPSILHGDLPDDGDENSNDPSRRGTKRKASTLAEPKRQPATKIVHVDRKRKWTETHHPVEPEEKRARSNFVLMDSTNAKDKDQLPTTKMELVLDTLYNDPSSSAAFAGVNALWKEARKKIKDLRRKDVQNYLEGHRTYTLMRPRRVRFPRAKTVAAGFMTDVQVDLADFQTLARHNRGHRYLLVAIDVLSKRLFVRPLRNKRAEEMLEAFKRLIEQMPMAPHRIFSDKGTEFKNRLLKEYFEEQEIEKHEPVHSSVKASIAERAIRNVKQRLYRYFAQKENLNWVDVVQKIVDGINRAPSRVHGMRPIDINFQNAQQVWKRMYGKQVGNKRQRFRKDEFVRMTREKGQFEKGYLPNYGDEILEVDEVLKKVRPVRYKLRDDKGEKFKGSFYEQELARFNGSWVCGLHSISYPYSWHTTIGTLDEQWIDIHFLDYNAILAEDRKRVIRIPVPKASHQKVEQLRDFLASTLKQQSQLVQSRLNSSPERQLRYSKLNLSLLLASTTQQNPMPHHDPYPQHQKHHIPHACNSKCNTNTNYSKTNPSRTGACKTKDNTDTTTTATTLSACKTKDNTDTTTTATTLSACKTKDNTDTITTPSACKTKDNIDTTTTTNTTTINTTTPTSSTNIATTTTTTTTTTNTSTNTSTNYSKSNYTSKTNPSTDTNKHSDYSQGDYNARQEQAKKPLSTYNLRRIIDAVKIEYLENIARFRVIFKERSISHLSFSPQLGYVLGFQDPQNVQGLTENMIIGNSLSSLLRVVSVSGATPGEYNEKIYDSPIFARVLPREINEIEIELRTMDKGRLVPFAYGTTLIVLIFKKGPARSSEGTVFKEVLGWVMFFAVFGVSSYPFCAVSVQQLERRH
uniref:Integrase catalytic domain-containing protein n=1 Tax=Globodera rostochiensis TaxID=31243 RepID=A0A914I583_GLORO